MLGLTRITVSASLLLFASVSNAFAPLNPPTVSQPTNRQTGSFVSALHMAEVESAFKPPEEDAAAVTTEEAEEKPAEVSLDQVEKLGRGAAKVRLL